MNMKAQNVYANTQINTASPGELTLMLYNGCIRFMKQAKQAIDNSNVQERTVNITKAQNIVRELQITLDFNYEISNNLNMLYDYIFRMLMEAQIKVEPVRIQECIELMSELRDTWGEALKLSKQKANVY